MTKFAPYLALNSIARGTLIDERVVLHHADLEITRRSHSQGVGTGFPWTMAGFAPWRLVLSRTVVRSEAK